MAVDRVLIPDYKKILNSFVSVVYTTAVRRHIL